MNRGWIWEDEGWSEFTEFAEDMGEAALDPLQAYVPGVDAVVDTINYINDSGPENLADIFVPEEFEGVVGVAGDYGPGGQNNTSYIFPDDPKPPNTPANTPVPMDTDLDEDPPPPTEEPVEGPPTTVFDDAWDNENEEEEIDFASPPVVTPPPPPPPPQPPVVSHTSHCCCCCCPCRCS